MYGQQIPNSSLSRLFGELGVVKTDPATQDFCARLGDLHFKSVRSGSITIQVVEGHPSQLRRRFCCPYAVAAGAGNQKMTELQQRILALAEEFGKRWSDE